MTARFETTPKGEPQMIAVAINYPVTSVRYNGVEMERVKDPWWRKFFPWLQGTSYWRTTAR